MKISLKDGRRYVVTFNTADDFLKELENFLEQEKITSAFFWAIGAASFIQLGNYSYETKNYELKDFNGQFEILNLSGNIAEKEGKPAVHIHGTFGDENFKAFGGHVFGIKVKPALELHLIVLDGPLKREPDA